MSRHNPERVKTWREVIEAWKQSGQTINAFCRDRKLTRSNFDRWRRIFAAEPNQSKPSSPSAFIPLQIVADDVDLQLRFFNAEIESDDDESTLWFGEDNSVNSEDE